MADNIWRLRFFKWRVPSDVLQHVTSNQGHIITYRYLRTALSIGENSQSCSQPGNHCTDPYELRQFKIYPREGAFIYCWVSGWLHDKQLTPGPQRALYENTLSLIYTVLKLKTKVNTRAALTLTVPKRHLALICDIRPLTQIVSYLVSYQCHVKNHCTNNWV